MKSKSKIESQLKSKTNPILVETIVLAKKNPKWIEVAHVLTGSRRNKKGFNLRDVERVEGDVVVCGKLLSQGEISKKRKIIALNFSEKAKEKLLKAGCEIILLADEIKKNKDAKGVTILK
ncbi:hypothetical protein HOD29_05205 [archaeon]|jgi:large subunit ribosomal protein L18e|nr:hypothetical protein [archaeon]